jgi:thioredoxin-like negative regulator of GroEL/energy-coupling factor transporter ATP-binding protein EcfA2
MNTDHDIEATYRAWLIQVCQQVACAGIGSLKDQAFVTITDLFVPLQLEREADVFADTEMMLTLQASGEAVHPREFKRRGTQTTEQGSIQKVLQQTPYVVILGQPGAGKTTLLKYLAVVCAEHHTVLEAGEARGMRDASFPLFIPLREYAAESANLNLDYSLIHYLYAQAGERLHLTPPYGFFEHRLHEGCCMVCLDGLDDVWDVQQRKFVGNAIKTLVTRFPQNLYLVTSRIAGYEQAPIDRTMFEHYVLLPLNDDHIHTFARTWFMHYEPDSTRCESQSEAFRETVARHPALKRLSSRPLLLTMMVLLHHTDERELPTGRATLYERSLSALIESRVMHATLDASERQRPFYRLKRRLLERLAYELYVRAEQPHQAHMIARDDMELLVTSFLLNDSRLDFAGDTDAARAEARAFVQWALHTSGVMHMPRDGSIGFVHLTFQEYLAACDIVHSCLYHGLSTLWGEVKGRLHAPHWRNVLLLMMGILNTWGEPVSDIARRILQAGIGDKYEPVLHRYLYLVARMLAEGVDVDIGLRQQVVDALISLARSSFWREQQDAFAALARLEHDRYTADGLLELALDQHVDAITRCDAAETLGRIGFIGEARTVLTSLVHDTQQKTVVRRTAAIVLGSWGDTTEASDVLLMLARNSENSIRDRRFAAEALAMLGFSDDAASVLRALAQDPTEDTGVRRTAAEALWVLGWEDEAAHIIFAIARDPQQDAWQRRYAAETLGTFGRTDTAAEVLLALARDPQEESRVRHFAAESLGKLGYTDETVLDGLLVLAQDTRTDAMERSNAAEALGKLGRIDEATSVLLSLARDVQLNPSVRRTAAVALGKLRRTDEAIAALLTLAHDPQGDSWERCTAAVALGMLGYTDKSVLSGLLALAQDMHAEDDERSTAAVALGMLGYVYEATETLLELSQDPNVAEWVRRTTYDSLKRLLGGTVE